ncbi:MAG: aldose epimerase family protein [Melioribacter sp.]|uniref:aldose epimerase family protein n=1 Tax=Melioribacter sp. TaxID=2052167 RepID=UPI003BDA0982
MDGEKFFGILNDGSEIKEYKLSNGNGAQINIINYGAIVKNIIVKDRNNRFDDIVLGYDTLEGYLNDKTFQGAVAGRYANRIKGGKFELDGIVYQLEQNEGKNHLHGGSEGFFKKIWNAEPVESNKGKSIKLTYLSKDGEAGYPGNLKVTVTYTLTENDELIITYEGISDKTTLFNPTHHSYFNLSGDFAKKIENHLLMINAENYTPVDEESITTGEIAPVENTPFDFRQIKEIGKDINADHPQLKIGKGYDHSWVLNGYDGSLKSAALLIDSESGRKMEVMTDMPGLQFYSGNHLNPEAQGKKGTPMNFRTGLCLETQFFPDSPNKKNFPQAILPAGVTFKSTTVYRFTVD